MSVIITGMEIPCDCGVCVFRPYNSDECTLTHQWLREISVRDRKCPLKSVEGLIEKLEKIGGDEEKSIYKNLNPSYVQGLKDAIKTIKEYWEVK